jgi:hypothetical protein
MTSTYSGSVSNSGSNLGRDDSESLSSNEIRADIDNTRASVGDKIDQLQARLDPSRLKAQAQETVQEMLSDTANSMTDYVRTHKDEMVSSLTHAARRNPLPTALIGLGLGWLVLESMAGSRRDDDDDYYTYERRNFRPRGRARYEGSTGRSLSRKGAASIWKAKSIHLNISMRRSMADRAIPRRAACQVRNTRVLKTRTARSSTRSMVKNMATAITATRWKRPLTLSKTR